MWGVLFVFHFCSSIERLGNGPEHAGFLIGGNALVCGASRLFSLLQTLLLLGVFLVGFCVALFDGLEDVFGNAAFVAVDGNVVRWLQQGGGFIVLQVLAIVEGEFPARFFATSQLFIHQLSDLSD